MLEMIAGVAIKAFLSQLFESLFGWLDQRKALQDQRELGRLESERDHAVAGAAAAQEGAAIAASPISVDQFLDRLDKGEI